LQIGCSAKETAESYQVYMLAMQMLQSRTWWWHLLMASVMPQENERRYFPIHGGFYRLAVQSGSSLLHVKATLKAL